MICSPTRFRYRQWREEDLRRECIDFWLTWCAGTIRHRRKWCMNYRSLNWVEGEGASILSLHCMCLLLYTKVMFKGQWWWYANFKARCSLLMQRKKNENESLFYCCSWILTTCWRPFSKAIHRVQRLSYTNIGIVIFVVGTDNALTFLDAEGTMNRTILE